MNAKLERELEVQKDINQKLENKLGGQDEKLFIENKQMTDKIIQLKT